MSDRSTQRPTANEKTRQRQRGPRSARKRAATAVPNQAVVSGTAATVAPAAAQATRTRRGPSLAFKPPGLSREQEFAYIRSDMRRLFIVAGSLLALMLVILYIVER